MNKLTKLKERMPFLESRWCDALIGLILLLNPIAMGFQAISTWRSTDDQLAAISLPAFTMFFLVNMAVVFSAIRTLDVKLFSTVLLTALLILLIALTVAWRLYL